MRIRLRDCCSVIRSKQAGPYRLTFDLIFSDREFYRAVKDADALTSSLIARAYGVSPDTIVGIYYYDPVSAVKITLVRPRVAGDLGDGDVYGCQQHAPLLGLAVELPEGSVS